MDTAVGQAVRSLLGARVNGRRRGTVIATYGPELITAGAWTMTGTVPGVDNGDGSFSFSVASNAAIALKAITLEDNATYTLGYEVYGWALGGGHWQVYGATITHLGTSITRTANGIYVEDIFTSGVGSLTNTVRWQTTGPSSPGNTYSVRNVSLKKKLT